MINLEELWYNFYKKNLNQTGGATRKNKMETTRYWEGVDGILLKF